MNPHQTNSFITVVVPTFNEEAVISHTIPRLLSELMHYFSNFECIAVDDGSYDKTTEIVSALTKAHPNLRLSINSEHRGKGYALRKGIREARGEIVCTFDCDLDIKPIHLVEAVFEVERGADAAIASRFINRQPQGTTPLRKVVSSSFSVVRKLLIGLPDITDTQCGCKAFKSEVVMPLSEQAVTDGFCFDAELLYLYRKNNHSVVELPVVVERDPSRKSRVRVLRESLSMTRDLYNIKRHHG